MFKKVLVAEDMDDINRGVYATLKGLGISNIDQVQYCDDAFLKIKKGILDNNPYDLLITDLSFKEDHRVQDYASGDQLIKALREKGIETPIIVYSVEDRLQRVRTLIHTYKANAYVCKGRNGLKDLSKAIESVLNKEKPFLSFQVEKARKNATNNEIKEYDIHLLSKLAEGCSQPEISKLFTQQGISPGSLSSVEKRIIKLKDLFRASNTAHLIAKAKDAGLI